MWLGSLLSIISIISSFDMLVVDIEDVNIDGDLKG